MLTRRHFTLGLTSSAFAGLALSGCATSGARAGAAAVGYGPLKPDPAGFMDLPRGFSYRVISKVGDRMSDGALVPGRADGMGAFRLDHRLMALVRNHELRPSDPDGPFGSMLPLNVPTFDRDANGRPLPGGTTTIIYDYRTGRIEQQFLSLVGTVRNCAGGATPWGSWLTCEEDVSRAGSAGVARDHGWVFEVPAARRGVTDPVPLTGMGRFNHEAAAVDPRTGIVYLTEDRDDSLFYRFLPERPGELARGGRLQALAFRDRGLAADSRNWSAITLPLQEWRAAEWIDLDHVEAPEDDLRQRGHARGAVLFARGEGIHFGKGELYFCCTSGGKAKLSQIMRYRPSRFEGRPEEFSSPGRIQLFVESADSSMLNFGDNITVAPNGHLIVCEDQYTSVVTNHLRGVTPNAELYNFARLHEQSELAGTCFSPDGSTMFVNVYSPAKTLAITGPWGSFDDRL